MKPFTLITGASSGVGKQLAFKYAKNGHSLILIARRINELHEIKDQLEAKYSVSVDCFRCDLNDLEKLSRLITDINTKYMINCLINNAGMAYFESISDLTLQSIKEQVNVNISAPILITELLIGNLNEHNGSVINVCSVLSYLPNMKSSVYTAAKHALYGFSNTLRLEYPRLHVLTVHPKTINTNFFKDKSYLEKQKKVLDPIVVANKIYESYKHKKRKCDIPRKLFLLNIIYQIFPSLIDRLNRKFYSNK